MNYAVFESPFGRIYVAATEKGIKYIALTPEQWEEIRRKGGEMEEGGPLCDQAVQELTEYFSGQRQEFSLPLDIEGTEFRQQVWQALCAIPYGETRNYLDVAKVVGNPQGCRAVGQANKANPLPLVIPCHRVVGKDGSLTGYMGKNGLHIKKYLLSLEQGSGMEGLSELPQKS